MGMIQNTLFTCDQCGTTAEMPSMAGGNPSGWLTVGTAGTGGGQLWFHQWACLRDYATARLPAPTEPAAEPAV